MTTDPDFEAGETALTMVQKEILGAKIDKFVDREKIMEDNLKRVFTILNVQCTSILLDTLGENRSALYVQDCKHPV